MRKFSDLNEEIEGILCATSKAEPKEEGIRPAGMDDDDDRFSMDSAIFDAANLMANAKGLKRELERGKLYAAALEADGIIVGASILFKELSRKAPELEVVSDLLRKAAMKSKTVIKSSRSDLGAKDTDW